MGTCETATEATFKVPYATQVQLCSATIRDARTLPYPLNASYNKLSAERGLGRGKASLASTYGVPRCNRRARLQSHLLCEPAFCCACQASPHTHAAAPDPCQWPPGGESAGSSTNSSTCNTAELRSSPTQHTANFDAGAPSHKKTVWTHRC
jgi:hypothetical protein